MTIQELVEKSNKCGEEVWIAGGASELAISTIENAIGVRLPNSYREFLKQYGGLYVIDKGISGIVNENPLAMEGGGIYADTIFMRQTYSSQYDVPDYLWVLQVHEDGAYCFNFKLNTVDDEFGIVNYEPYLPESTFSDAIALTFSEYIEQRFFSFLSFAGER